jgi:hypothetical protein
MRGERKERESQKASENEHERKGKKQKGCPSTEGVGNEGKR